MDQVSFGISGCVGVFVAAVLGQSVVFRAASLLPSDFNRDAFLIFGNGPMVGLALVVIAATHSGVAASCWGALLSGQSWTKNWTARADLKLVLEVLWFQGQRCGP